jgi:hypothetical protein
MGKNITRMEMITMMKKLGSWFKENFLDDPFEMSAAIAFGIGFPLILLIFGVTLYLLK